MSAQPPGHIPRSVERQKLDTKESTPWDSIYVNFRNKIAQVRMVVIFVGKGGRVPGKGGTGRISWMLIITCFLI